MKKLDSGMAWGIVLIGLGLLFLLQTLGVMVGGVGWLFAPLFVAGGAVLLYVYITKPKEWWAIIPAAALAGIGAAIGFGSLPWAFGGTLAGASFLGAMGLAFWIIYLRNMEFWWAIIPAGILSSVAGLVLISELLNGDAAAGVFFLGMATTFGLVYLLTGKREERMTWALIPGGILAVLGLILLVASVSLLSWLWPLALIGVGGYILLRARTVKTDDDMDDYEPATEFEQGESK
jgi:hypothetical protein